MAGSVAMIADNAAQGPEHTPGPYVENLPVGQRLPIPGNGKTGWEIFPFEGDLRVRVPAAPEWPEPPRQGEAGAHV
ncbi:hypothetical protein [Kitasatospora sp. NPDC057223]|uniref:hypothetical protein n=1 Tax=Kitasatospora sp. NPDC057223 TaxID=3346055 RepID=UPI0036250AA7